MPDVLLHFGQSALAGAGGGFELQSELQDPYLILIFSNFAQHLVFLKITTAIHLEFKNIGQGVRRFKRFEFLSEKISFTALGGSKSSSFEPDTSHP